MARSDDEELGELLNELATTLADLRTELDDGSGTASARAETWPRRPPTPGELLQFTEEYTIPTVIATLEATVRALELLGELIRLTSPGGAVDRRERRLGPVGDGAVTGVERTLDRLRTTLAEADLPQDPAARALVEEARSLSEEVERRLSEVDRPGSRGGDAGLDRGVGIEVREEDTTRTAGTESEESDAEADSDVEVDAELRSIKDDLDERQDGT
jgi:hypothetical protein